MRVTPEQPLEAALILGLDLPVELVGDPLADLGEHGARVQPGRDAAEQRADDAEVAQVALDGLRETRMLHLDRHVLAVARARAVDLAERRDRERLLVEVVEQRTDPVVEILLDDLSHVAEGGLRRGSGHRPELDHGQEPHDRRSGAFQAAELRPELLDERDGARVLSVPGERFSHAPARARSPRRAAASASARHRPARARSTP